jgi:DNA-binding transcriptional MerR regulator
MSDTQEWRIDDLAQRSGVSVDTIRFYQREGLLHAPTRRGRTVIYGPAHLHRLDQIRDLQARHLSLAAIRNLLDRARLGLAESLFAAGEGDYTRSQLATAADVDRGLIDELETAGVLRDPGDFGRESYDDADLRLLTAVRRMLDLGLPRALVVRLGEIYASSFAKMQGEVLALFTAGGDVLANEDLAAFHERIADQLGEVLKPVQSILDYSHTRSVQTMTMSALRDGTATPQREPSPGAGPRKVISRRAKTQRSPSGTKTSK